jgi:hypothetical protein
MSAPQLPLALAKDTSSCTIALVVGVSFRSWAQQLDNMAIPAGPVKTRPAVQVFRFGVRPMVQQLFHNLRVPLAS